MAETEKYKISGRFGQQHTLLSRSRVAGDASAFLLLGESRKQSDIPPKVQLSKFWTIVTNCERVITQRSKDAAPAAVGGLVISWKS